MKENEMGGTCSTHGKRETCWRNFRRQTRRNHILWA